MIDKKRVQSILNAKEDKEPIVDNKYYEEQILQKLSRSSKTHLSVIICNNQNEKYYQELVQQRKDILICNEVSYLNSINHLDGIKSIIIDYASFQDDKEIAFLMRVFQLLHRDVHLIICKNTNESINGLFSNLQVKQLECTYVIEKTNVSINFEGDIKKITLETKDAKKKRNYKKHIKLACVLIAVIALISVAISFGYTYISNSKTSLYNRNMNIQLDMETSMVLPINITYSDNVGKHIVIEEVKEDVKEDLSIMLYNDDKKEIMSDVRKTDCPNSKCSTHYELIFNDEQADYYILQISNPKIVRNIEIDKSYFN